MRFLTLMNDYQSLEKKVSVPTKFYRAVGIESYVKKSDKKFGELNDKSRNLVATGYLMSGVNLAVGIATLNPVHFILAAGCYLLGREHHRAMGKNLMKKKKQKPKLLRNNLPTLSGSS
jgi:hypothetical protein